MSDRIDKTLVVYVAFADFGEEPIQRFVRSYIDHPAGRPHYLLIACKRYGATLPDIATLGLPPDSLVVRVPDVGFDLGTYRHVVERFAAPRYCLFNSRSRFLIDGWLDKLETALALPGVAVAGATASRQSLLTDHMHIHRHAVDGSLLRRLIRRSPANALRHWLRFPPFPNPHLRTNAILMERELMLDLWNRQFRTKLDTAKFENGRDNLTRRIGNLGLRAVVVGRHGVFDEGDWPQSETFWSGDQRNLLVADNQTDRYEAANVAERRTLAALAWRDEALPSGNSETLS